MKKKVFETQLEGVSYFVLLQQSGLNSHFL